MSRVEQIAAPDRPSSRSHTTQGTDPPETNGVVERFNQTLRYEHLYRHEIADALELSDEVEVLRELYNEIRPHETLGQIPPMDRYLAEPAESHLSEPETVQES